MDDLLKTPMQYLSKGSLQKVAVIQALLQTPDILLMDEPLNGTGYRFSEGLHRTDGGTEEKDVM